MANYKENENSFKELVDIYVPDRSDATPDTILLVEIGTIQAKLLDLLVEMNMRSKVDGL